MPALQSAPHKFIVRIEGTPQEFTEQTVALAMNFVKKELILVIEQSLTAQIREHIIIQDLIDHPKRLVTLDITDYVGNVIDTIKFHNCEVADHNLEFNYSSVGLVVHIIAMKYDKIDFGNNKAAAAFASAMSVVGKP